MDSSTRLNLKSSNLYDLAADLDANMQDLDMESAKRTGQFGALDAMRTINVDILFSPTRLNLKSPKLYDLAADLDAVGDVGSASLRTWMMRW